MKKLRLTVQLMFTVFTNGYAYGFLNGKIYQGSLKYACVPGLNCYSCPGAVASCPLGALQALLNQQGFQIPFGILGFFFLFGSLFGRFICGWLCPFGLVQDLPHKIPFWQIYRPALFCMHRFSVFIWRICKSSGILQIYLSLRDTVWRNTAFVCK